jgi:hypothetical protein
MLLFVDESGHDRKEAPYEVLAGVAIRERDLWNLIQAIRSAELDFFGLTMASVGLEFKGRSLLKKKVFRLGAQGPAMDIDKRRNLARDFLQKGWREVQGNPPEPRSSDEFTAYGQAVLSFVTRVFELAARYRVKTFAAMVRKDAPRPTDKSFLRKDYAYLFERFFYYLESLPSDEEMGLVAFDELEKAQSRILINQLERYFLDTEKGYRRSARIVPEPFFVHSDLTTAVQLADIMGYCLNWGVRLNRMTEATRPEIEPYGRMAFDMRYVGKHVDEMLKEWPIYGIFYVEDLRPKREREEATE